MNLLARLENMHVTYGDDIFRETADALGLEQLVSDKLYRALVLSAFGTSAQKEQIIIEALEVYELTRLAEVRAEMGNA